MMSNTTEGVIHILLSVASILEGKSGVGTHQDIATHHSQHFF